MTIRPTLTKTCARTNWPSKDCPPAADAGARVALIGKVRRGELGYASSRRSGDQDTGINSAATQGLFVSRQGAKSQRIAPKHGNGL